MGAGDGVDRAGADVEAVDAQAYALARLDARRAAAGRRRDDDEHTIDHGGRAIHARDIGACGRDLYDRTPAGGTHSCRRDSLPT